MVIIVSFDPVGTVDGSTEASTGARESTRSVTSTVAGVPAGGANCTLPLYVPGTNPEGCTEIIRLAYVLLVDVNHEAEVLAEKEPPATATFCGAGIPPPCTY